MLLDRYAACCVNFVLVATRIAVLAARSAAEDTGNQPRALRDINGTALGWLVDQLVTEINRSGDRQIADRAWQPCGERAVAA